MSILVECDTCQKKFTKPNWAIHAHNFCSKECRLKWFGSLNPPKVNLTCTYCDKEFERQASRVWPTGNNFCSQACQNKWHSLQMRGNNNPFVQVWNQMSEKEKQEYATQVGLRNSGRRYSEEINKKKGLPGKLNPFFGKHHTRKTRKFISRLMSGLMQNPDYRKRVVEAALKGNRRKPNKAELKLENILDRCFPEEWEYTGDGYHTIGGFAPDFTNCNGKKTLIELFGRYWHEEVPHRWNYTELGRIMAYNSLGYRCLIIWDYELKDEETVVAKIGQFIKRRS